MTTERIYTIPLRRDFLKTQKYKRAKRAVKTVRKFLKKHMKSEEIKIGKNLNEKIWKHGIKNPPGKIKINVTKDDEGIVKAELIGIKYEQKKLSKKEIEKEQKLTEKIKKEEIKEKKKEVKKEKINIKETQKKTEKKPTENKKESETPVKKTNIKETNQKTK